MNQALNKIYCSKWNELIRESMQTNAANPLLIKVNDSYEFADLRVMIVGQETDGWAGELEQNEFTIEDLQAKYFKYLYENRGKYGRPFWNRKNFRYFQEHLTKRYRSKKVELIWNNANKLGMKGKGSGEPTDTVKKLEKNFFNVFEYELKVLKPHVILFVTGPNRALPTKNIIVKTEIKGVDKVELTNFPEIFALRTYHPNARIKGGKKELKVNVFKLICEHIDFLIKGVDTIDK